MRAGAGSVAALMTDSDDVSLESASAADAPLLENLLELYVHDLSDVFDLEPGPDGRFGYDKLRLYWSDPEHRHAFLIRHGERLAGFALVTHGSPATDDPDDLDVAEFFVLRAHRRFGVGKRAAMLLWNRLPGRWVVRVAEGNVSALRFWENAIREFTGGDYRTSEHAGDRRLFRVFAFETPPSDAEGRHGSRGEGGAPCES